MTIENILQRVTVMSKDDGKQILDSRRIDVIKGLLQDSEWKIVHEGDLSLIYAVGEPSCDTPVTLISSHIDCVYSECFCRAEEREEEGLLRGTFDNAATNAALIHQMLEGKIGERCIVAFTGDEERDTGGAKEVMAWIEEHSIEVALTVVTDVTNVGWQERLSFTIENDQCIDLLTAHSIVEEMKIFAGEYGFVHHAEPDESWYYAEYGMPTLSLCLPTCGDMHSDAGSLIRKDSLLPYCQALSSLSNLFSTV